MLQGSYQTQKDMNRIDIPLIKSLCHMGHFILKMSHSQFRKCAMGHSEIAIDYNYLILRLNYFGTLYAQ